MSRKGRVYSNGVLAGVLEKRNDNIYSFIYNDEYMNNSKPPISVNFPKSQKEYYSKTLFPFFSGLSTEGYNREIQCRLLNIDIDDTFSLLMKNAHTGTIGAITIREVIE